jgi:hypothetical protein
MSFQDKDFGLLCMLRTVFVKLSLPAAEVCMVKTLSYKLEGRGFETQRGECIFSIYLILPAATDPGVHSAPNIN